MNQPDLFLNDWTKKRAVKAFHRLRIPQVGIMRLGTFPYITIAEEPNPELRFDAEQRVVPNKAWLTEVEQLNEEYEATIAAQARIESRMRILFGQAQQVTEEMWVAVYEKHDIPVPVEDPLFNEEDAFF